MQKLLIVVFSISTLTGTGQKLDYHKVDSQLYAHAVDSMVKYILNKENPAFINLDASRIILKTIPDTIGGQRIYKKKRKIKSRDNSILITIKPLGGIKTKSSRSVFLIVSKRVDGHQRSWEGYAGYSYDYFFEQPKDTYVLRKITKSIIIR